MNLTWKSTTIKLRNRKWGRKNSLLLCSTRKKSVSSTKSSKLPGNPLDKSQNRKPLLKMLKILRVLCKRILSWKKWSRSRSPNCRNSKKSIRKLRKATKTKCKVCCKIFSAIKVKMKGSWKWLSKILKQDRKRNLRLMRKLLKNVNFLRRKMQK